MEEYSILAVDDQDFNLIFLKKTLAEYQFLSARNGRQALELLRRCSPDLILLDIVMPEMDGYEVLRQLKYDERTRNIPVIFLTSLDSIEDEEKGFNLGAVDYITKPFKPTIIQARVKNTLRFIHQQKLLERMSHLDGLTEIPNRRFFEEKLASEFGFAATNKRPLSLIMIDVDFFKKFNDQHGHSKGDEALVKVAQIIRSCLNEPHEFLARYGGEEFVVILPDTDAAAGSEIAEKIRYHVSISQLFNNPAGSHAALTVSVGGYSMIPANYEYCHSILEKADACLYQAKKHGRNCVKWDYS
ncbi:response regulator receiver modulated diguanylate cyclase [Dehalobacter sp. UNSWDHB]|jgi:diguanylate cyclase (GGDEF) domain|uniref:diguanylate cyclase n=1 Tax=unclassified Dehalobacter TaxID=2635733 RepID=UPI00028B6F4A|nr:MULTISPECIES: diguanylate cyclase [unclassified Dehalobacter]AFV03638.1 response regulator receiver modulated diguanylate cyclase [Dehalobacter sp. DCA]AFV06625.1 response regulator receiver modulated diguanylate cyclase [Dehalobacter sp. CF]EQB20286.1 response regulator receiver modulated diguanylate cyclase [Dehalobacter sp. UNSWDHB]